MSYFYARTTFAVRPKYNRSHSAQEWLRVKPLIANLYCEQDLKLKHVMDLMREEHHYDAT
jgi:hypothetical protein